MEVYEKINEIIKQKKLTKRAFANILINLKPQLKITGETPVEGTIYGYLSGKISIPIELIPYISEALDITEQELFYTKESTKKKCIKYLIDNSGSSGLEELSRYINSRITQNINVNYGHVVMSNRELKNSKIEELIELMEFAPPSFLDKVIVKLREYKNISEDFL